MKKLLSITIFTLVTMTLLKAQDFTISGPFGYVEAAAQTSSSDIHDAYAPSYGSVSAFSSSSPYVASASASASTSASGGAISGSFTSNMSAPQQAFFTAASTYVGVRYEIMINSAEPFTFHIDSSSSTGIFFNAYLDGQAGRFFEYSNNPATPNPDPNAPGATIFIGNSATYSTTLAPGTYQLYVNGNNSVSETQAAFGNFTFTASVPEPSTALLAAFGLLLILKRPNRTSVTCNLLA